MVALEAAAVAWRGVEWIAQRKGANLMFAPRFALPRFLGSRLARFVTVRPDARRKDGGVDGTRTRDPRRDRPVF